MNEMSNHLGIGVGAELVALGAQPRADGVVVLDDAVVHHRDAAADVRVGIALGGHAVGRPAGVADADGAFELLLVRELFQFRHALTGAQALQTAIDHGHSHRVVAAVLEAAQAFQQDRDDVTPRYRGDDSTHRGFPCSRNRAPAVSAAAGAAGASCPSMAPRSIAPALTISGWRPSVAIHSTSVRPPYARKCQSVSHGCPRVYGEAARIRICSTIAAAALRNQGCSQIRE